MALVKIALAASPLLTLGLVPLQSFAGISVWCAQLAFVAVFVAMLYKSLRIFDESDLTVLASASVPGVGIAANFLRGQKP
jgi:hypothetical protein